MQKVLGQDIKNLDERKQFLIDNADEVVEMDYSKAFDADELAKKKTTLAEKSIKIHDLQEEIKDFKAEKNLELKPLKEDVEELLADIKAKSRVVTEKVYKFVDEEELWHASIMQRVYLCQVALQQETNSHQLCSKSSKKQSNKPINNI